MTAIKLKINQMLNFRMHKIDMENNDLCSCSQEQNKGCSERDIMF